MNLYLLMIIVLALIGIKFYFNKNNTDYLSKDNTTCIKGIFVLIIFYSHLATYIDVQYQNDFLMFGFRNFLSQLMVTMFLFYSGYGVYESIKNKKKEYVDLMPKKRILKTYVNFWIAIVTFIILNLAFGREYSIKDTLLSFTGWTSIGNSNWYIFSMIIMYILTYISFKIFDQNNKKALILNISLTILFIITMALLKEEHWFNTILAYPFGLVYSYKKNDIEKILIKNKKYYIILALTVIAFIVFKKYSTYSYWYYEACSLSFVSLVILLTYKININNKILLWIGRNTFWIYILQRIPMIALREIGFNVFAYKYALACFIATLALAFVYSSTFNKVLPQFIKNRHDKHSNKK